MCLPPTPVGNRFLFAVVLQLTPAREGFVVLLAQGCHLLSRFGKLEGEVKGKFLLLGLDVQTCVKAFWENKNRCQMNACKDGPAQMQA